MGLPDMPTAPAPTVAGTFALVSALALAAAALDADTSTPSEIAQTSAWIVGAGLVASLLLDLREGIRNLIRTDIVLLLSLYGLILFERLQIDASFDLRNTAAAVLIGIHLVLWAFGGIAIGRHLSWVRPQIPETQTHHMLSIRWHIVLMGTAFALAVLHIILSTKGSLYQIYEGLLSPRFSKPWARGRLGGWHTLLNELSLLFYLIPPLTALLIHRWKECRWSQRALAIFMCFFVFFEAFAGGTRNVFLTHLISFSAAYLLMCPVLTFKRLLVIGAGFAACASFATHHMLEFRQVGLRHYLTRSLYQTPDRDRLFVDDNLSSISKLSNAFPEPYPYLGWEIPVWAAVKPIPRALWPGKPDGLSISIEQALHGNDGYTIATTYIGEAYMAFGISGVIGFSLLFGSLAHSWTRWAGTRRHDVHIVIYASGFFTAAITMRSMIWTTTAMLPTIALIVGWHFYLRPRLEGNAPAPNIANAH